MSFLVASQDTNVCSLIHLLICSLNNYWFFLSLTPWVNAVEVSCLEELRAPAFSGKPKNSLDPFQGVTGSSWMGLTTAERAKKDLADSEVTFFLSWLSLLCFFFLCPTNSLFAGYITCKQPNFYKDVTLRNIYCSKPFKKVNSRRRSLEDVWCG